MYGKPIHSAMKLSPAITFRLGVRFVAVFIMMCCTTLVHISALDETLQEHRRGEAQNSNRVSADGAEFAEKQSVLHRERRAVKNNATRNTQDIEKRLKAMEERYASSLIPSFLIL